MLRLLGLIVIIGSLIFTFWWIAKRKENAKYILFVCIIAIFSGMVLLFNERIIEITIEKVGTIKAAADKAEIDVKQISDLKDRISNQSATVDLVAQQAAKVNKLIEDLIIKNRLIEIKMVKLDSIVKDGTKIINNLKIYTEFNNTILAAQADSRKSFDKLRDIAQDKNNQISKNAERAWLSIMDSHESPFMSSGFKVPWKDNFDPQKLTMAELKKLFLDSPQPIRLSLLEYIWRKTDLSKKSRLEFLIDVIRNDESLQIVEYAARYLKEVSKQNFKNLFIEGHIQWWNVNKNLIENN
jgi:hypothetical protein